VKVDVEHRTEFSAGNNYSGSRHVFGWQLIGGARVKLFTWPVRLVVGTDTRAPRTPRSTAHRRIQQQQHFTVGARWTF